MTKLEQTYEEWLKTPEATWVSLQYPDFVELDCRFSSTLRYYQYQRLADDDYLKQLYSVDQYMQSHMTTLQLRLEHFKQQQQKKDKGIIKWQL